MEIEKYYDNLAQVYQQAFAGDPWFEVIKCADLQDVKRCVGGFSTLPVGTTCEMCGNCLIKPAYEIPELIEKFTQISKTRSTAWYFEGNQNGITLAALAWKAYVKIIAEEKYKDNTEMQEWIINMFGDKEIIWLDEVFADRSKKPKGNLSNFRSMCFGFVDQLKVPIIAFRTINERMVSAAKRDFDDQCVMYKRYEEVPDRRDFIVINFQDL